MDMIQKSKMNETESLGVYHLRPGVINPLRL